MKNQFKHLMIMLAAALSIFSASTIKAQILSLTPSNYNGNNVSCFGSQNGSIDLTITGGTPPYTIRWSTDEITEDITNLPAGYYRVEVDDADAQTDVVVADITLTQPEPLQIGELTPYVYQNGYNVSQFGSCNGSVVVNVSGGVTPYSYLWEPGQQTSGSPTNLCANENQVRVTDANGCETGNGIGLSEPERDDWTTGGNWNSNPATQFIGTMDNKDLSFRTYNQERFRIKSNGTLNSNSLSGNGTGFLMVDANGDFFKQNPSNPTIASIPWMLSGNTISASSFIGSVNNFDLVFKTHNATQMILKTTGDLQLKKYEFSPDGIFVNSAGYIDKLDFTTSNDVLRGDGTFGALPGGAGYWNFSNNTLNNTNTGNVGIGTSSPSEKLEIAHNTASPNAGGMALHNLNSSNKNSEIKFKANNSDLWAIGCDVTHSGLQNFFIYDNTATGGTRFYIDGTGKIGIGNSAPTQQLEISSGNALINFNGANSESFLYLGDINHYIKSKAGVGVSIGTAFVGDVINIAQSTGNVGIGTIATEKLDVNGKGKFTALQATSLSGNSGKLIELDANGNFQPSSVSSSTASLWNNNGSTVYYNSGKVFIGMSSCAGCALSGYSLYVNDGIMARDVKVTAQTPFPDYVFSRDYKLMSLYELEQYIKTNNHLPEMPSAKEVEKNNGFEVGDIIIKLVKQNEEQALYLIEQQKQIDELKLLVKKLERRK